MSDQISESREQAVKRNEISILYLSTAFLGGGGGDCGSQTSIYIRIIRRQNTKAHSQSFWFIRSAAGPKNLYFCQVYS